MALITFSTLDVWHRSTYWPPQFKNSKRSPQKTTNCCNIDPYVRLTLWLIICWHMKKSEGTLVKTKSELVRMLFFFNKNVLQLPRKFRWLHYCMHMLFHWSFTMHVHRIKGTISCLGIPKWDWLKSSLYNHFLTLSLKMQHYKDELESGTWSC